MNPDTPHRQLVSSGALWEAAVGYSRAVRVGAHIYVSGTVAARDGAILHPGDAAAQAREALAIIARALAQAGAELHHVVRTRVYLARIEDFDAVGRVHGQVFGSIRPASLMLQAGALIGGALVEIEAEAVLSPE